MNLWALILTPPSINVFINKETLTLNAAIIAALSLFATSINVVGILQTSSFVPDTIKAKSATASVFSILDRKSKINSSDESGISINHVQGEIQLQHVNFTYPTRPEVHIFQDLCLNIHAGKTLAIIGESGSGKSTIISLMQRFYDPDSGCITLDGIEIQKMHLKWLRQQIGLISDAVAVARLINATLVIPEILSTTSSKGISSEFKSFAYLYNEDQFMAALAKDVNIIKTFPKNLKEARRKQAIPLYRVQSSTSPYFYRTQILPMLRKHSVVEL